MSIPLGAEPIIRIDWQADDYANELSDVTDRTLGDAVTVELGRDTARATSPAMIPAGDLVLWNEDALLSPENPSSPIYQYIKPARPMQIGRRAGESIAYRSSRTYRSGAYYRGIGVAPFLTGYTDRFDYRADWGNRTVKVSALGSSALLKRKIVSVAYSGTTRVDTAIQNVLTAAGWPSSQLITTISDSILTGFWVAERPAWDVLQELIATEGPGSALWEDGFGRLHFENRNWRATATRSTTSQATLHDGTDSGICYTHLEYDPRWEDVINRATATTTQRELGSSADIWRLGADLTFTTSEVKTVKVKPNDPFQNAITPLITTDYTVTGGAVSISMDVTSGAIATLTITATSGTPTVSDLKVRGQPFESTGETVVESTTTSETGEEKTHDISIWQEVDPAQAEAITDAYLERYQESRPIITIVVPNADATAQAWMLDAQISDRVHVVNAHLGLDLDVYIERIEHEMGTGGRHVMTVSCEPVTAIGSIGSRWDVGLWDSGTWGV